ncbi:uncharacterized protein LOC130662847 [Hydractinia symbiolongicarpus]|uniref:uncharacterized protein LOC130662803 n=1 Tax=Hydractinia symbiolongicarpus TaxID=13093 RepID=UPI0025519D76|nr:uncharacterized protein LOC130662803 [Hydractinia symbiolongicarpus]XP_057317772.1 uncharacterized protein LOC130662847 [Hydractinia symbiolongicarpus]
MSRRNLKRVDYSKFSTSCKSDSEDDFQDSPPSVTKKVKTIKDKNIQNKKTVVKKNQSNYASNRTSRTSNVEALFEQDVLTAIEVSRSNSLNTKKKKDIISISDSEEEVVNLLKKKRKSVPLEDSSEEESSSSCRLADTVLIIRHDDKKSDTLESNIKEESNGSPLKMEKKVSKPVVKNKENKKNVAINNLPTEDIRKTTNNNGNKKGSVTPKQLPNKNSPVLSSSKVLTPGRLRLGLSRNIRIAKPLHSNVNMYPC